MASGTLGSSLRHLRDLFGGGTAIGLGDGELLRRYAASHDGPAFEALVARHGPMVAATCRAVLRDHHDVEDAFQATFLVLARKAASIHASDALGGWLHHTAYRAAVQRNIERKRRRRHESESLAMDVPDRTQPGLDFDVRAILHDEIDRLPERHRLPVVLCDLEGLTYEQAAGRLQWTAPTVYHRLAKGRKRLRDRLVRRGVTATAVGAAMEWPQASATAAFPAAWAQTAVAAATGGPIPAAVAALAHTLIRSLLMTRLKIALVTFLAMAALITTGVVAIGAARLDDPTPPRPASSSFRKADEPKLDARPTIRTTTLAVEARDLVTDEPIAGVRLEFSLGRGSKKIAEATDASGTARFSHASDIRYFYVSAARDGMVPQAIRWDYNASSPAVPDRLLFQMEKATTVSGRVVDPDQKPIAGATVVIDVSKGYPRSRQWVDFKYELTRTDANGRWSFSSVPAQPDSIKLAAYHYLHLPEGPSFNFYLEDFKPISALRDGSAALHLPGRGTPIEGTVVAPDGRPVANAEVIIGSDRLYANSIPAVKTDGDGRFTLGIKPGGASMFTARCGGFGPVQQPIKVGSAPQRVTLRLQPAHTLSGRVVDRAGKPVPRAYVRVTSWRGKQSLQQELKTDQDGRFAWNEAPGDEVRVSVSAEGYASKDDLPLLPGQPHDIVLTPPTTITGAVVDAGTGQPLPQFTLMLGTVWTSGEHLIWQGRDGINREARKTPGSFEYQLERPAHQYNVRVSSDGYLAEDSGRFSPDGTRRSFTFRLTRAEPIRGVVQNPDGSPGNGSFVYLVPAEDEDTIDYLDIENGDVSTHDRTRTLNAKVGPDGRFSLPPQKANFALVALADAGFAVVSRRDFRGDGTIRLKPWARVSGTVVLDGKPAANLGLLSYDPDSPCPIAGEPRIEHRFYVKTDDAGRFDLRRVMPGRLVLARMVPNGVERRAWYVPMATVDAESGKTYDLRIGHSGRRVTGRLTLPGTGVWMIRKAEIVPKTSTAKRPVSTGVEIRDDGVLHAVDLRPGDYVLRVAIHEPPPDDACGWGRLIAAYTRDFTVSDKADDSLLDLGPLQPVELGSRPLQVGDIAPDFAVRTLDGKDLKLADFRGKFVLLDFWATWCAPCVAEMPNLEAVHKAFDADPRFAMISLSLDETPADAMSFVRSQKLAWHHGHIGPDSPVASEYNATAIPATFLIGSDGKILAADLRGEKIKTTIEKALRSQKTTDRAPAR